MPWSSTWSIRTSTIGRSPEIPCAPEGRGAPAVSHKRLDRGPQGRIGVEDARREPLEEVRLVGRDPEVAQLDLRLRPGQARRRARTWPGPGTCRPARGRPPASRRRPSPGARARSLPGARRTRRRRLKTGSSTVPAVLESGRRSSIEIGSRTLRPRPRKRARSVSYCTVPTVSPCTVITWAAQTGLLPVARPAAGASSASSAGTNSVWTKRFEKAGCAASAAAGASTISA